MEVTIDKDILFALIASHSKLSQAEYHRNPKYNNTHFSYKAEEAMLEELQKKNLRNDLFDYMETSII